MLAVLCGLSVLARADGMPDLPGGAAEAPSALDKLPTVDRIVVRKSQRSLVLMHGGNVVRSYHVQLGLNPVGQKERSGDFRTPEGTYRLERRNCGKQRLQCQAEAGQHYPAPARHAKTIGK